jgi:Domain of unknown function (DUF4191)
MSAQTPAPRPGFRGRIDALRQNYRMTRETYPRIGWEMLGLFVLALVVITVPFGLLWNWPTAVLIGLPFAILAATYWFSRKAMKAAYTSIEGQPGAAAAVVQSLRGNWTVTPAVAVTKNQDLVSRVVGRCGVVLVSEGPPSRVAHLLANERKKTARWLPETPIFEIQVGRGEDQVPLDRLQKELSRLPNTLRPAEVTDVRRRLDALANVSNPVPMPKGPLPKNARMPRPPRG